MIEAKKVAYADMIRYDADPRFAKIPVAGLLSKEFARTRAKLIDAVGAAADLTSGSRRHRPKSPAHGTRI